MIGTMLSGIFHVYSGRMHSATKMADSTSGRSVVPYYQPLTPFCRVARFPNVGIRCVRLSLLGVSALMGHREARTLR